jgi:SAM-dependent methyltransferase
MKLFFWSAFALLAQLSVVRFSVGSAGALAYYSNLILIFILFWVGCGMFKPEWGRKIIWLSAALTPFLVLMKWLSYRNLLSNNPEEFQWINVANWYPKTIDFDLHAAILLVGISLIPAGILIGSYLGWLLREGRGGIRDYLLMTAGGFSGAIASAALVWYFPNPLFALILLSIVSTFFGWKFPEKYKYRWVSLIFCGILIFLGLGLWNKSYWSPYQRVDLKLKKNAVAILTNGFYISSVSTLPLKQVPNEQRILHSIPFSSLREGDRVLILGSGAGSTDVREALAGNPTAQITAVEIDPIFVDIGKHFDPDKTYLNPRVQTDIEDGRRFLAKSKDKFNVIYYPFLDSQTNASSIARFRLDSFLYTKEGFQTALEHLSPDGILYVNFCSATPWIGLRMMRTLESASGKLVKAYKFPDTCNTLFIVNNDRSIPQAGIHYVDVTEAYHKAPEINIATDDWPFLYSKTKKIPIEHYRLLIASLCLLIGGMGWFGLLKADENARPSIGLIIYAFLSGAAFFFLEIRAISLMTPIWGTTFLAQSTVIASILLLSLGGAFASQIWFKGSRGILATVILLAVSLLLVYFAGETARVAALEENTGLVILLTMQALPLAFAGLLYGQAVKNLSSKHLLTLQGWNWVGGALGALGEVVVVGYGFSASFGVAVALYTFAVTAILTSFFKRQKITSENIA